MAEFLLGLGVGIFIGMLGEQRAAWGSYRPTVPKGPMSYPPPPSSDD